MDSIATYGFSLGAFIVRVSEMAGWATSWIVRLKIILDSSFLDKKKTSFLFLCALEWGKRAWNNWNILRRSRLNNQVKWVLARVEWTRTQTDGTHSLGMIYFLSLHCLERGWLLGWLAAGYGNKLWAQVNADVCRKSLHFSWLHRCVCAKKDGFLTTHHFFSHL